jgi:hypothetical protein
MFSQPEIVTGYASEYWEQDRMSPRLENIKENSMAFKIRNVRHSLNSANEFNYSSFVNRPRKLYLFSQNQKHKLQTTKSKQ